MCQIKPSRFVLIIFLLIAGSIGYTQFSAIAKANQLPVTITGENTQIQISQISLKTNDLIYDPKGDIIYASIPGTVPTIGNTVMYIHPSDLSLGPSVFVGSTPNKLALSDDSQYLYVGIDGAGMIRRVNVISQTAEIQFGLGSGFCGTYLAEDIVVLKNTPNSIAVSRRNTGCSPRHEGVAIYDDGVQRPLTTPRHTGSNVIEPSEFEDVLYGYNKESTENGFRVMSVISTGVVVTTTKLGLISGNRDIRYDTGLVYATSGAVVDPISLTLAGTFPASGLVLPDTASGHVYFLTTLGDIKFHIFNQNTFTLIESFNITGVSGTPSSLIKVGENSFAFRTSGEQVFLIQFVELPPNLSMYLPVIKNPVVVPVTQGIQGSVTLNGIPIANILLDLAFYNGASWSAIATTATNAEGIYLFENPPSLGGGQMYSVIYQNTEATPGRLWIWATQALSSYSAGTSVEMGNFDIAEIALVSPPNGAYIGLPFTFHWAPRLATPTDSYEFNLYDLDDGFPYYYSPMLGHAGSYTLTGLPGGFVMDYPYVWEIWVYSPNGGIGISYEARYVVFLSGQFQQLFASAPILREALPGLETIYQKQK